MNKKKDIIALALSVSFVMGGASLSHADEINNDTTSYINENYSTKDEEKALTEVDSKESENYTDQENSSDIKENQNLEIAEENVEEA